MVELTETHKANLRKLSDYLIAGNFKKQFHMRYFCSDNDIGPELRTDFMPYENECGTIACAIGHGPDAGIPISSEYSWTYYCELSFGIDSSSYDGIFDYLFGSSWFIYDNTAKGAGERIAYFLEHGKAPDNWHTARVKQATANLRNGS